jgi:hypothetical protein
MSELKDIWEDMLMSQRLTQGFRRLAHVVHYRLCCLIKSLVAGFEYPRGILLQLILIGLENDGPIIRINDDALPVN